MVLRPETVETTGILERLELLEQALRKIDEGAKPGQSDRLGPAPLPHDGASRLHTVVHTPVSSLTESEHHQTAKFLDSAYTREDFSVRILQTGV